MRPARLAVPGYALALTALALGPLARPGYLLLRDAVSTPRSHLSDSALGLGGTAPRAVPQDFAIAALSAVLDGGVVVKALLGLALLLAGWGAGRLAGCVMPEGGLPGQLVAVTVAIWNPYVAERLLQGHWSLLLGYGCLLWVALAVLRLRAGGAWTDWAGLVFFTALAGLTPTGLILAAIVGLVCVAAPGTGLGRPRCAAGVAGIAALAAGPWVLASALGGALGAPQSDGLEPFAARAEPGLATLGSLAGLGGIWNADAVPGSRATLFALVGTAVLLAVVAAGATVAAHRPAARPLLLLAAVAVLLPAAAATGPGLTVLRVLVEAVPGLAVLRDGQKWVALAVPGYTLAAAGAVLPFRRGNDRSAAEIAPKRKWRRAVVCCAALIAVLPDLAWGGFGRINPVHYPPAWPAVAAAINAEPGQVAVLPADTMRRFGWAGPAPVLDPLPRWVRADVLATGDLQVSGRTVTGEGDHARSVQQLLLTGADPADLRRAGVGWVVVEHGTPGELGRAATTLHRLPVAYSDPDLTLYRVDGAAPRGPASARQAVLGAHLAWATMVAGGALALAAGALRRRQSVA